ncbi:LysR substrate-binding domain-containing protein [Nocardia vinacea]|uniref:LysR substrate-binding domain-containing protein n=1 Tax=Nocardia vinacea TaxID=96468 RepID=UPI002E15AD6B|nr:LysR substrate-binding domain-containing protein [Nocardia vinacea]
MRDGAADLAIVSPGPPVLGLGWQQLSQQRLALAMPADHRSAGRRRIWLRDVDDAEFIVPPSGFDLRRAFDELCSAASINARVSFETVELATVAALVAEGLGLAVVPMPRTVPGVVIPRDVSFVPLADEGAVREVGVVWSTGAVHSDAVRAFREYAVGSAVAYS